MSENRLTKPKSLVNFIRNHVPAAMAEVDMVKEIRKAATTVKPVIAIDILAINRAWQQKHGKEMLCGGRSTIYKHDITELMRSLSFAGAELIFVADAYSPDENYDTWVQNAENKYQKICQLFDKIHAEPPLHELIKSGEIQSCKLSYQKGTGSFMAASKKFGELVLVNNLNRDIASLATERRVLAVMSDDQTQLVFNGEYKIWQPACINFKNLSIRQLDKRVLREALDLSPLQMKLLLVILGAYSLLTYEQLFEFHEKFGDWNGLTPVEVLAAYVKEKTSDDPTEAELKAVALEVLANDDDGFNSLKAAYDYLDQPNTFTPAEFDDNEFIRKLLEVNECFTCSLVSEKMIYFACKMDDMRLSDLPTYLGVTEPLRRRLAGMVWARRRVGEEPMFLVTVLKAYHETPFQKQVTSAIFPPFEVPDLQAMMFPSQRVAPEVRHERLKILTWLISSEVTPKWVLSLPIKYVVTAATVLFMAENGCLQLKEADVLLLSCYKATEAPRDLKPPSHLHPRAFRIAFLYQRIYAMIRRSFFYVGYHIVLEETIFDGFLFHKNYNRMVNAGDMERAEGIEGVPKTLKLYESCYTNEGEADGCKSS